MPSRIVMSAFVCAGVLLMGSHGFRIQGSSTPAAKSDGIHDGPSFWWSNLKDIVRGIGGRWTGKCSVFDFVFLFSNGEQFQRENEGQPFLEGAAEEHYKSFLIELGKVGLKIQKLKRLQAGCEDADDDVFQRQTFDAVAKLATEFPTPRDLFSLMPEHANEAKKKWTYTYTSPNKTDFEKSYGYFVAWYKQQGLEWEDVDRERMRFNGLFTPEFQKRYPKLDDVLFPVNMTYTQEATETFNLALIDAIEEDWLTVSENPVSRDAYVNHFLSKPESKQLPSGGYTLLKEALEGAFDVCRQLTMPTATKLGEHAFRYCSALASGMLLNNIPSDEC